MKDSLHGLKVIDFTQIVAGPTCTMMLADRGADVIKIESLKGDLSRQLGPWKNGESIMFSSMNRNKRSVVLDLKKVEHVDAAERLIMEADILVESFRPGVMERLGLGYETLRAVNPKLIYCSISAFGQRGPGKEKPGVDGIIQAVSGLMSVTGAANGEPTKVQPPIVDTVTGFLGTIAILDALRVRDKTGQGQWLDVNMFASAIQLQQTAFASYFATGEVPSPNGSAAPYAAPNEAYPTQDGWIMVAAYHDQRWRAFCSVLQLESLLDDERFLTLSGRVQYRKELFDLVSNRLRARPTAEWLTLLSAADIICGPVNNYAQVVRMPEFMESDLMVKMNHSEAGEIDLIGPMRNPLYEEPCAQTVRSSPRLGEHNQEVLAQLLGAVAI